MYERFLATPKSSVFLFGPRGVGKTTLVRQRFPYVATYDLLDSHEAVRLEQAPQRLYEECSALDRGSWVVIDEVQRVPALLNEVHRLIEQRGLHFVLTGSSARKLRRGGVNLLAGRALTRNLFPLVSAELAGDFDVNQALRFGGLPNVIGNRERIDYLQSYTSTYLLQEIQQEAFTRNLGGFARFLEIAARQNGQRTNMLNISRDAGVKRSTVGNYFEILVDTLIGFWLPAWELKPKTRQVRGSKFYFFDCGVCRALSRRAPYPPAQEELGPLLETFVINELRAYLSYGSLHYPLHYWSSYSGVEADIVLETARGFALIEIKAASRWERKFQRGLTAAAERLGGKKTRRYGVYLGSRALVLDDVRVYPIRDFLAGLWAGDLIR